MEDTNEKYQYKSELAEKYGVTLKTFRIELNAMKFYDKFPEAKNCKMLSPLQIKFIKEKIGE